MKLAFDIARRYLFAKKSTNAINIITSISVFGLTIGTAALILVLSVFNGFEEIIFGMLSNFNPEIKVSPALGKTFDEDMINLDAIKDIDGIAEVAFSLEEVAFFDYRQSQDFGVIKGVSDNYALVTGIDTMVRHGKYLLGEANENYAIIGAGLRSKLSVSMRDNRHPLQVYMVKKKPSNAGLPGQPFRKKSVVPIGTFAVQHEYDQKYVITSLALVRALLDQPKALTTLEFRLKKDASIERVKSNLKVILGAEFLVEDRYEQDAEFLKLLNIEKWLGFAIVSMTLILVAFNLIGSLWLIVIEKKQDISLLRALGAQPQFLHRIFLIQGMLLSVIGLVLGTVLALGLYFLQKQYDLIPLNADLIVSSYPISLRVSDLFVVIAIVLIVGLLASLPVAIRAKHISTSLNAR